MMIGRRVCTCRKLVLLSLATAVTLLILMMRNETFQSHHQLLISAEDGASDKKHVILSPRYFASSSSSSSSSSSVASDLLQLSVVSGVDVNDDELVKELKTIGLEMNSDPLDVRLQVHPSMNLKDAEDVFHRFVAELHVECRRHVRIGNISDGGWDMCIALPYLPRNGSCLVYSFGIGDNWSFDDDAAKRFGCTVRSFDPSINISDHQRSERVSFRRIGIGSGNVTLANGWRLMSLTDVIRLCHDDDKVIDYLKIDVESYEWDALEEILRNGKILSRVKQLGIEVHTKELDRISRSTKHNYFRYWTILHRLELVGFRRWHWHFNLWGFFASRSMEKYFSCCYETVYINIAFLPTHRSRSAYTPVP